jgi:hypothetical protein
MDISQLKPYRGLHTSLIHFDSGYVFRISNWTQTPTEFGSFSNLWMVTGEDRRFLFADPPASGKVVCIYHNFDDVVGAKISVHHPSHSNLTMSMNALDGTLVEMTLLLATTVPTRLLEGISHRTPKSLASRDPMIRLADKLTSAWVARGKSVTAGYTDTGQPFFVGKTDRLYLIKDGNALLNGDSLGSVCPPRRKVGFGEFEAVPQAYVIVGTLYLPYSRGEQVVPAGG